MDAVLEETYSTLGEADIESRHEDKRKDSNQYAQVGQYAGGRGVIKHK